MAPWCIRRYRHSDISVNYTPSAQAAVAKPTRVTSQLVQVLGIATVALSLSALDLYGQAGSVTPTPGERFELLHNLLGDQSREYVNDVLKTIAFLLVAIGWILTSKPSREFLGSNVRAHSAGLLTVALVAVIHVALSIEKFVASQQTMKLLFDLDYFPREYYAVVQIGLPVFLANVALHIVLFGTLFVLVKDTRSH